MCVVQILQHGARDGGVQEWWGVADWFQVVSQDVEGLVLERQQLLAQVEQLRHDLEQQQHRVLASEKVMMMMIIMEIIIIIIEYNRILIIFEHWRSTNSQKSALSCRCILGH
jgi:hypothetical protein